MADDDDEIGSSADDEVAVTVTVTEKNAKNWM